MHFARQTLTCAPPLLLSGSTPATNSVCNTIFYMHAGCFLDITQRGFQRFNISEIIKGGSLGHGTAVPGDYDIDLVIYSRGMQVPLCDIYLK